VAGLAAMAFAPTRFYAERTDLTTRGFVKAFKEEYGRDAGVMAALGYDAGVIIIHVLEKAGNDRDAILREMAGVRLLDGATGQLNAAGQRLAADVTVLRRVGQHFEYEATVKVE